MSDIPKCEFCECDALASARMCFGCYDLLKSSTAKGRLAASAPDLLRACEEVIENVAKVAGTQPTVFEEHILGVLRSAVAKARGG